MPSSEIMCVNNLLSQQQHSRFPLLRNRIERQQRIVFEPPWGEPSPAIKTPTRRATALRGSILGRHDTSK